MDTQHPYFIQISSFLHLRIPSKTPHLIYLSCLLRLLLAGTVTRTLLGRYSAVPSLESVSRSPRDRGASERKPARGKRHFRDTARAQTVNTTYHWLPLRLSGPGSVGQSHCQVALFIIFPHRTLWRETMVRGLHTRVGSLVLPPRGGCIHTSSAQLFRRGEVSLLFCLLVSV